MYTPSYTDRVLQHKLFDDTVYHVWATGWKYRKFGLVHASAKVWGIAHFSIVGCHRTFNEV